MEPGYQSYDCTGCGDCCRGRFAIVISQEDRDRIVEQKWDEKELGLGGKPLFTPQGDGFKLAHREDGSCVFLQPDAKCRIHALHGEAAKPLACRLYPFTFVPTGNNVRVDVRFDCPATAGNLGRPITAHKSDLQVLVKTAVPPDALTAEPPPLYGKVRMTWDQLARVTQAFERVLLDVSLDITRRVGACVNLVDVLREAQIGDVSAKDLPEFLDDAASHVQEAAVHDSLDRTAPNGTHLAAFRQLLNVYGRIDTVGEKPRMIRRLNTVFRMLAGKGIIPPLRDGLPNVTFADVENARGIPSGPAAQAIERYLHVHLTSMGFFGQTFYNRDYLDGMSALLLTYPLICWFARVFAISEGLETPDVGCVERAIMIVDHQHGITPLLNLPSERARTNYLCERSVLRSLVVWYGS